MREFFKGWRRKAGCVTLVIAVLLAASWARSNQYEEILWFRLWFLNAYCVHKEGRVVWSRYSSREDIVFGTQSTPMTAEDPLYMGPSWRWEFDSWMMPHWAAVIPLTLLSAYLLLWKPRRQTGPEHA